MTPDELKLMEDLLAGKVTINHARSAFGCQPLPGGDVKFKPIQAEYMLSNELAAEMYTHHSPEDLMVDSACAALSPSLDMIEQAENEVCDRLERAFGGLFQLPYVAIDEPKWLDAGYKADRQMQRKLELAGLDRITQAGRIRYHEQLREGQGYDDGCGFRLRCWMAALRYPFLQAWSSRTLAERI